MAGFDIGFRQLDDGDPSVPATALISENITLTRMRFERRYHQLGLSPPGKLSFGIPVTGLRDWFGREYRSPAILPFHHPSGIDGVSERGFEAYTVSFEEAYLDGIARDFQLPVPGCLIRPAPESRIDCGETAPRLHGFLNRIAGDSRGGLGGESGEELMITLLGASHAASQAVDRSSSRARDRAVTAALAYMADHPDEVVTVRDICAANGIALRTLNRAFRERFGIGPKAYLKRQRLSAVRRALLSSPPGALVSDVANRWGFWHMGQFADDSRSLFGELPSRTARH